MIAGCHCTGLGKRRLWIRILTFFFCWILIGQFQFQVQQSYARVADSLMLLHGLSSSWVHWIGFGIFDEKIKCFLQFVTWARNFKANASLKINLQSLSQMISRCLRRLSGEVWVLNCIQVTPHVCSISSGHEICKTFLFRELRVKKNWTALHLDGNLAKWQGYLLFVL